MNIVKGDLLTLADEGEFDIIVHGCNCFNNMGAGIAVAIARKYPAAYIADSNTTRGDKDKLGTYTQGIAFTKTSPVSSFIVINAYTQYGCNASKSVDLFEYEAFQQILNKLAIKFPNYNYGFPLIGCGLAGGNKVKILNMINTFSGRISGSVKVIERDNA